MTDAEKIKQVKRLLIALGLGLISFNKDALKSDDINFLEFCNFVIAFYHDITELVEKGVNAFENSI